MGFFSILMGLIAELLVRTYHESQGKTVYHIREMLDIVIVQHLGELAV